MRTLSSIGAGFQINKNLIPEIRRSFIAMKCRYAKMAAQKEEKLLLRQPRVRTSPRKRNVTFLDRTSTILRPITGQEINILT